MQQCLHMRMVLPRAFVGRSLDEEVAFVVRKCRTKHHTGADRQAPGSEGGSSRVLEEQIAVCDVSSGLCVVVSLQLYALVWADAGV